MGEHTTTRERGERRGAKDGSDRIARIARWLEAKPVNPNLTELLLVNAEDGETIARWPISDVVGASLSYTIDNLILDAATDAATTVSVRLQWMAGDVAWACKGFRARCDKEDQENIRPLDGSNATYLQMNQRHLEAMAAQLAQITARSEERVERMLGIYERMLTGVLGRLEQTERQRDDAQAREAEALELADNAASAAEEAHAAAEAAAADDMTGKVVSILAKQLTEGAAGKK